MSRRQSLRIQRQQKRRKRTRKKMVIKLTTIMRQMCKARSTKRT